MRGVAIRRTDSSRRKREQQGGFANGGSGGGYGEDDDGARSIRTIVPYELERVDEEEDEEEERRRQRIKLGRLRTPEPMSLGTTHEDDKEACCRSSPWPYSVIDQVFGKLMKLLSQLKSAVELSHVASSASHCAKHHICTRIESYRTRGTRPCDSVAQVLNEWKKSIQSQWSFVHL